MEAKHITLIINLRSLNKKIHFFVKMFRMAILIIICKKHYGLCAGPGTKELYLNF